MTRQPDAGCPSIVGDVVFGNMGSPVAVCTLATRSLLADLAGHDEIAIAGRCQTENIGIERMVQNLVANPDLRYFLLCGQETSHAVGQTILSLHARGIDDDHRVIGSVAPDPVLPNLTPEQLRVFQERITLVDMIGARDPAAIIARAGALWSSALADKQGGHQRGDSHAECSQHSLVQPAPDAVATVDHVIAEADSGEAWEYDPLGYFLILVDRAGGRIFVEHHDRDHRLLRTLEGTTAQAIGQTIARRSLASNAAHLVYLGRELMKAELALRHSLHYEQDVPFDPRRTA